MESQVIFDLVLGVLMVIGGWIMRVMWESLKDLRHQDRELADKVAKIEVLVAGEYVKKDEFERMTYRLFEKLDAIEAKLSQKVDR